MTQTRKRNSGQGNAATLGRNAGAILLVGW
jgi:hypothetical protein